jgi:hypothetical protein
MRTGAAVPAAEPSSATGGRGSNDAPREGVLPQLLPDILSGRTSRRLHCAQRLGAMQSKRQCIGSEAENLADGARFRNPTLVRPRTALAMFKFKARKLDRIKIIRSPQDQGQRGEKNFVQPVGHHTRHSVVGDFLNICATKFFGMGFSFETHANLSAFRNQTI